MSDASSAPRARRKLSFASVAVLVRVGKTRASIAIAAPVCVCLAVWSFGGASGEPQPDTTVTDEDIAADILGMASFASAPGEDGDSFAAGNFDEPERLNIDSSAGPLIVEGDSAAPLFGFDSATVNSDPMPADPVNPFRASANESTIQKVRPAGFERSDTAPAQAVWLTGKIEFAD